MVQSNDHRGDDDSARAERYVRGDAAVFDRVDGWIRAELRRGYPRLRDEHEDLSQTVHGKLLVNLRAGSFQGRSQLRTYVSGIVHRTAIDRLRELYRNRALTDALGRKQEASPDNPYQAAEMKDEMGLVARVLFSMPEICRRLWKLVFVDKQGYDDVAAELSIPPGTVKSRMWHCRRKAAAALTRLRRIETVPR